MYNSFKFDHNRAQHEEFVINLKQDPDPRPEEGFMKYLSFNFYVLSTLVFILIIIK